MSWVFVISFISHCNEKQYKQRNANKIWFTPKEIVEYDQVIVNLQLYYKASTLTFVIFLD